MICSYASSYCLGLRSPRRRMAGIRDISRKPPAVAMQTHTRELAVSGIPVLNVREERGSDNGTEVDLWFDKNC